MKHIEDAKRYEKYRKIEQDLLTRHADKFENGTLTRDQMNKLGREKYQEYVNNILMKTYGKKIKWYDDTGKYIACHHCIESTIFSDGYVSDEQLKGMNKTRKCCDLSYSLPL